MVGKKYWAREVSKIKLYAGIVDSCSLVAVLGGMFAGYVVGMMATHNIVITGGLKTLGVLLLCEGVVIGVRAYVNLRLDRALQHEDDSSSS